MGLRNAFGDIALESTQEDIKIDHGELLLAIFTELRIMNKHLEILSGEPVRRHDIEDIEYDS